MQHAGVVADLAEGQQQEAHVHALHNRAQASHGRADTHALSSAAWQAVSCVRPEVRLAQAGCVR